MTLTEQVLKMSGFIQKVESDKADEEKKYDGTEGDVEKMEFQERQ